MKKRQSELFQNQVFKEVKEERKQGTHGCLRNTKDLTFYGNQKEERKSEDQRHFEPKRWEIEVSGMITEVMVKKEDN